MASLFRRTYKVVDPKTGQVVKKKYKRWYIKYRDADGLIQRVPGYADKTASLQKAAELERKTELQESGVYDPFAEHRKRPLSEHIGDFEKSLKAKGNTKSHITGAIKRIKRVVAGCSFKMIRDVSASKVERYLDELRADTEEERGISIRTRNYYLQAIKQFMRWMVLDRRTPDNPLVHLKRMNESTDKRHFRRALSMDDLNKLIEAAMHGVTVESISGEDRAMIYVLGAWTGLRRGEIASLTRKSFELQSDPATVTVKAAYSKRRREDVLPLHPAVVERLQAWFKAKGKIDADTVLFPIGEKDTAKMMQIDLAAAGVAYCNEDGLFADFHAIRHTFITNLCKAGVSPKTAQSLARHCSITLTMDIWACKFFCVSPARHVICGCSLASGLRRGWRSG